MGGKLVGPKGKGKGKGKKGGGVPINTGLICVNLTVPVAKALLGSLQTGIAPAADVTKAVSLAIVRASVGPVTKKKSKKSVKKGVVKKGTGKKGAPVIGKKGRRHQQERCSHRHWQERSTACGRGEKGALNWRERACRCGVIKNWACTSSVLIRIPLRVVPPLRRGGRGYPRVTTAWCAVPGRLSAADLSHRPNVLAMPLNPPCPPFSGGDVPMTRNKNTRLESTLRARSTLTFRQRAFSGR